MRIIIAGAGDVGFHIARLLANEKHDITLIDLDKEKLSYAAGHLDVATQKGNSAFHSTLEAAGVNRADLLIAATSSEESNLTTAILAKHLGAQRTVARISNVEYLLKKEKADLMTLGIDEIISPESLAAREIKRLVKNVAFTDSFEFGGGQLSLIGISIDEDSSLVGKTLEETSHYNPHLDFITVAILRDNQTIIPRGNTTFRVNDHAYFIAQPNGVEKVKDLTSTSEVKVKNIMILGGTKVGFHAAKKLSLRYNVKLIEPDKDKCFMLADELQNTLIINGDVSNVELMEEENIDNMDAFIAVTNNSETNIISCLMAKNHGVSKTIAMVENINYIHLSQKIGVDTLINKKLIAANFVFRYIRKGDVVSLTSMHGVDAEILEFEVNERSKILGKNLSNIDFPKSAIVGGIIRDGNGLIPGGDFEFQPKDHVVVLARPECIRKIESYF